MKHRNKFVNYKNAKAMDLISARVEAAKLSRVKGITQYIIEKDDEFTLSTSSSSDPTKLYGVFVNGGEDKGLLKQLTSETTPNKVDKIVRSVPAQSAKAKKLIEGENKTTMAKTAKKTKSAKKATKKVAAKKEEKLWHEGLIAKATTLRFSEAQWEKLHKLASEHGGIQKMSYDALREKYNF